MPGRGDASPTGDRSRSPSPVQDGSPRAGRTDEYLSSEVRQQRNYEQILQSLRSLQSLEIDYKKFRKELDSIIVDKNNPIGYTQGDHDRLKGLYHEMHQLDERSIDFKYKASTSEVPADRKRFLKKEENVNKDRGGIWRSSEHQDLRGKYDRYCKWLGHGDLFRISGPHVS